MATDAGPTGQAGAEGLPDPLQADDPWQNDEAQREGRGSRRRPAGSAARQRGNTFPNNYEPNTRSNRTRSRRQQQDAANGAGNDDEEENEEEEEDEEEASWHSANTSEI